MVLADNLVVHPLCGFFCNFSNVQHFCRFCNCSQVNLKILQVFHEGHVRDMSIMYKTKMLIQLCHLFMVLRKIHPLIICNIPM